MDIQIEPMTDQHWPAVRQIYEQGIATGDATFERDVPEWDSWNKRHMSGARLVARKGGEVIAWAALSPVSTRQVYSGVAEVSVYVAANARGSGVGRALLQALVKQSESVGIWTLQAGIFPENVASINLHKACGFREVGRRQRLGKMTDRWRDVVLLERRSKIAGI